MAAILKILFTLFLIIPLVSAVYYENVIDEIGLFDSTSDIQKIVEPFVNENQNILVVSSEFLDHDSAQLDFNEDYFYLKDYESSFLIIISKEGVIILDNTGTFYDDLSNSNLVKSEIDQGNYDIAVKNILNELPNYIGKKVSIPTTKKTNNPLEFNWLNLSLVIVAFLFIVFIIFLIFKLKKHQLMNQNYNNKFTRRQF